GLRGALEGARALGSEGVLEGAEVALAQARGRSRAAIDAKATLERITALGAEVEEAAAALERARGWRARVGEDLDALALDLCLGVPQLWAAPSPLAKPDAGPSWGASYLVRPRLQVAAHYEPAPDLFVHDRELGTVGLVYTVEVGGASGVGVEELRPLLRDLVERATYLRHLLLSDRSGGGADVDSATVELVVAPVLAFDCVEPALEALGHALRHLSRTTDCLHAVGINLLTLVPGAGGGGSWTGLGPAALRRAFAWLLPDTRRWFEAPGNVAAGGGRLESVELEDYRLPGLRRFVLDPRARLHLLHGHNGSGKSSLVEALELMLTGSIERLAGVDDYAGVIRNRWAPKHRHASVELRCSGGVHRFSFADGARPPKDIAGRSAVELAASFRLDQTVMDRLVRTSDADRAAELLAAFFAEDTRARERWRQAVHAAEVAVAHLPARVRRWLGSRRRERQDLHEVLVDALASLDAGQVDPSLLDAVLPVPLAELRVLHGQVPEFAEVEATLGRQGHVGLDGSELETLQLGLERLRAGLVANLAVLEEAQRSLEQLAGWWKEERGAARPQGLHERGAAARAIDGWLELSALVELGEQQLRILDTLSAARESGWSGEALAQANSAEGLLRSLSETPEGVREDLRQGLRTWTHARDRLALELRRAGGPGAGEAAVEDARGSAGEAAAVRPTPAVRMHLDAEAFAALDQLGWWWRPDEPSPGLGERIREALVEARAAQVEDRAEQAPRFAGVEIGAPGWTEPMREAAARMLDSLRAVREAEDERPSLAGLVEPSGAEAPETSEAVGPGLTAVVDRVCQARALALEAHAVGVELNESFVARLAAADEDARGLIDALNELMALFTPARWAYEDVNLRLVDEGDTPRLHFETGSETDSETDSETGAETGSEARAPRRARAELRLNTAQLNAFTLALFLLCAPRVRNPLGLLVLDDPLQNMDELTVTCLARGLSKFLAVLPEPWSLLMLFHGESDLIRFREEVECGVYFLPWLSPTARGSDQTIAVDALASRLGLPGQSLRALIRLVEADGFTSADRG
ncbi:hypothetical protein PPSIR1_14490, partial [Plesiocystis pacifica SIR-1]